MLSSQQTVVESIEVNYKVNVDTIGLVNVYSTSAYELLPNIAKYKKSYTQKS